VPITGVINYVFLHLFNIYRRVLHVSINDRLMDKKKLMQDFVDAVAVLHFCNWGGSRGGIGCDRGGTKSFNLLTPTVAIWVHPACARPG